MRTIELIQLLRKNECASNRHTHLEQLGHRGVLHLLGELCKWLLSEFSKYKRRQGGPDAPETEGQTAVKKDAWRTIKAIQFVLAFIDKDSSSTTPSPPATEPPNKKAKIVLHEEEIMDHLVKAMTVGCTPLGPRVDSSKIQLACAKTLRHCLSPLTRRPPFPPEALVQRLLQLSDQPSEAIEETWTNPLKSVVLLLNSDIKKLQDYGLQLLLTHRSLLQNDIVWQTLPNLHAMLDQLKADLTNRDEQQAHQSSEQESSVNPPQESILVDQAQESLQLSIYVNALNLLQYFLKELYKEPNARSNDLESMSKSDEQLLSYTAKLRLLENVIPIELIWDLWTLVQHGSSTLMGWYSLYITEHDSELEGRKGSESTQSTVLEFLTKLILQALLVSEHQPLLLEGDRPLILAILRRTTEFLEDILPQSDALNLDSETEVPTDIQDFSFGRKPTYPLRMIKARQGLLDSMLNILLRSFRLFKEGTKTVSHTRLLESLLFLLSSMDAIIPEGSAPPARETHTKQCLLEIILFLFQSSNYIRLGDVSRDMWEQSSQKIVDWMMEPIEQEALIEKARTEEEDGTTDPLVQSEPELRDDKHVTRKEVSLALLSTKLFRTLWMHLPPNFRGIFANRAGPRLFQLCNIRPLLNTHQWSSTSTSASQALPAISSSASTIGEKNDNRRREMLSLLLDMMAHFGNESSVRIYMRDHWAALVFLECLLGAAFQSLTESCFSPDNSKDRMVIRKVLEAMCQFWYDQAGLERLVSIRVDALAAIGLNLEEMLPLWPEGTLPSTDDPLGQVSVIPLLLKIVVPLRVEMSYQMLFRTQEMKEDDPCLQLYDQRDPLVIDASILLERLCQSSACQQYLVSHSGVVWCLSWMMTERSLMELQESKADDAHVKEGTETGGDQPLNEHGPAAVQDAGPSTTTTTPPSSGCSSPRSPRPSRQEDWPLGSIAPSNALATPDTIQQILFNIISKLMSSSAAVKAFVSNNTVTEIFGAVVALKHHNYAMSRTLPIPSLSPSSIAPPNTKREEEEEEEEEEEGAREDDEGTVAVYMFPCPARQAFLDQLLTKFRSVVQPTRWQFDSLYQFVGGRSALDLDQQVESVFWLREYAAVALFYMMKDWPPEPTSRVVANSKEDDATTVLPVSDHLSSETVYGDICRMLTLEMEYEEDVQENDKTSIPGDTATQDLTAQWRRFSAATALQTRCWSHASAWQEQFEQWRKSLATVYTSEWQDHVTRLSASSSSDKERPVTFLIATQKLTFPNRSILARSSPFFASLFEGAYQEAEMDEIRMHDVDPSDLEMILEIIKESQWTSSHLLPLDLTVETVLRLLVYSERFQVPLVKRLAEAWILQTFIRQAQAQKVLPSPNKHVSGSKDADNGGDSDVDGGLFEDTLVQVYGTCSSLAYGSFDQPTHPFFDLLWNTLRLMLLHLGSVAIRPGFRLLWEDDDNVDVDALEALANQQQHEYQASGGIGAINVGVGGQDKIQVFLQAVTKLIKFG
ncbi:hypothetical protein BGW42_006214 [Actinomortierella wolfii]|nr:hypothetical protein BGW42_006214 [Actinomortierella wolfii]